MRQTPWSRIIGWNSVNKEVQEIVGNGKLTGSVRKEVIAVLDTIWISVQNRHSRILLQDPLRSRVWKMHREPEVLKVRILAPEMEIMRATPWSRIRDRNSAYKEFLEIVGNGSPSGSVLEETIAVSATLIIYTWTDDTVESVSEFFHAAEWAKTSRTRSPRGKSPIGRMSRLPCKEYFKGTCTTAFSVKWDPPECLFCKSESWCRFGEKWSCAHLQVRKQPSKFFLKKIMVTKVQWLLKITRQMGCVFQDVEPPKCTTILRKSSNLLKPIRCVQFTKAVVRHANIRDQNPSLGSKIWGSVSSQRTNITRAPWRRRIGRVVLRAEKNLWFAYSRSQSSQWEGCESRNNHRYAVVVQDLATQWIQSYPCKTKTSQETQRSLQKFLEPDRKPKVIYTDNSLEFGKACEDLSWNHCTSTPHRSETNGIAEKAVRRVKEGTSAVLLQSGLNESWWADSMECYTYLRNVTDLLSDGKTPYERRFGQTFKGPIIPFGSLVEYHPITAKDQSRMYQFGKKVLAGLSFGYA